MSKSLAITSTIIIAACAAVGIYFITQIIRHFDDVIQWGGPLLADAMKLLVVLTSALFGTAGFFAMVLGYVLGKTKVGGK